MHKKNIQNYFCQKDQVFEPYLSVEENLSTLPVKEKQMTTVVTGNKDVNAPRDPNRPKYFINIEGTEYPWPKDTITTEEIAALGGWTGEGVIEIDANNLERTLASGEVIKLKPGQGFAKKIKWKRGDGLFDARLSNEMLHLQGHFKEKIIQIGNWFLIKEYPLPEGWNVRHTNIAFRAQPDYPGTPPYGFFVPTGLRFNSSIPGNYQDSVADIPPFAGQWGMFSWAPDEWRPSNDLRAGFNLLNFALSFAVRLGEGA